ncbi:MULTISPECIES: phospholipase D-like domain-containing protein [unclassified Massilia]|uniref:phospholipase D-like domain-containing protein n=1 Tax=unclassified Massilia TaxID=2609279 RepID=UPI000AEDCE8B|nr:MULTISPECIES: phospholipase D-like domain-containing protein [unclassified Massilia]
MSMQAAQSAVLLRTPAGGQLDSYPFALPALVHATVVLAGLLLYVVATRLRRQRHHPSAAFAWVLTIAFLPYLGIPLFLLFGASKLVRPRRQPGTATPALAGGDPPWACALLAALGLPPPTCNRAVRFHVDGLEARRALLSMIDAAERRILLSTFILGADDFGDDLVAALVRRAEAGVGVCVLLDALARLRCGRGQLRRMRTAGIAVRWVASLRRHPATRLNLRYHRKLVVCDSSALWSGGRNFAQEYFTQEAAGAPWEDLSFDIRGPLAGDAELLFRRDWLAAGGPPFASDTPAPAADTHLAQIVSSGPDHADDNVYALLLASAFHARRRIVAVSPYFIPDDALLMAWRIACERGVRLTLLLPARSNHRLADWGRARALRDLCAAGAEIRLFPRMIHAKAVIVDDAVALCGSTNLDGRSLFLNFEMMVAFYGRAEIDWLAGWVLGRAARSAPYRAREPSWLRDLGEGLVRVIGFQL